MTRILRHASSFLLAALPTLLVAQSTTTSALQGLIRDGKGQPVPGAQVRIASPALIGGERLARTGDNGTYRLAALPPGTYTITVEAKGFVTRKTTERLVLGDTTTLNLRLAEEAGATVEVVGSGGTGGEVTPVGVTTNLSAQVIENLPTGRDLTQVAALTPGVTVSDNTSGATVRAWGGDGASNAYTIDGLNVGDAKSGEKWVYANPDWFSEVQVGGLGAPAEYGGFSGAYINGVVKSGGNELRGGLNVYYQRNSWAALRSEPTLKPEERPLYDGAYTSVSLNVGGPIVKDRLWYFVSAETNRDSATDSPVGVPFPVKLDNPRFLAKFTWQALPTATWDAFFEYDAVNRENKGGDRRFTHEATQKQDSPSRLFITSWTQTLGGSSVMTLRYSGLHARDDRSSYNPGGFTTEVSGSDGLTPTVLTANGVAATAYPELVGRNYWGNVSRGSLLRRNYRGRDTFSGTFDVLANGVFSSVDSHALRMGFEVERSTNEEQRWIASPNGIAYRTRIRNGGLRPYRAVTGTGRDINTSMDRTMFFVQDTWTVGPRLQIRPGVRFEQFEGGSLWKTRTVAPRLGLTWNVTADQSQVAKLHLGRYFSALSADYYQFATPGAFWNTNVFYWGSNSQLVDPYKPNLISVDTQVNGADYYYAYNFLASNLDPNHKQPYTDEVTASYDVRLGRNWALGVTGVLRSKKDILVTNDPGWNDPAYVAGTFDVTSPLTGQTHRTYITDLAMGDPNNGHRYVITNSSQAKNVYRMLTVSADRAHADGWSLSASLTWARAEGNYGDSPTNQVDNFNDPNFQINAYGKLPYVNDREARVRGTIDLPWRARLSGTFTYLSGERYTPLIDMAANVFELNQNAMYIFAAPRGSAVYPSRRTLDLRLTQVVPLGRRATAEVFLDVFNVLNETRPYSWSTVVADDSGLLSSYQRPTYVDDPRRLRLGVKVKF